MSLVEILISIVPLWKILNCFRRIVRKTFFLHLVKKFDEYFLLFQEFIIWLQECVVICIYISRQMTTEILIVSSCPLSSLTRSLKHSARCERKSTTGNSSFWNFICSISYLHQREIFIRTAFNSGAEM